MTYSSDKSELFCSAHFPRQAMGFSAAEWCMTVIGKHFDKPEWSDYLGENG
jgi:hypothetical protein